MRGRLAERVVETAHCVLTASRGVVARRLVLVAARRETAHFSVEEDRGQGDHPIDEGGIMLGHADRETDERPADEPHDVHHLAERQRALPCARAKALRVANTTAPSSTRATRSAGARRTAALYGPGVAHEHHHLHDHRHIAEPADAGAHAQGHHHHQAPGDRDWAEFGARLQLEGDVAMPIIAGAIARIAAAAQAADLTVDRILDLGSGPGIAAVALAAAFPSATAVAVDSSGPLLALVHERAVAKGVGDRVRTEFVDLEQPLDALGAADVVWASRVLHHMASPADILRQIHALLRPGGLLAIVEFGAAPHDTLPADFDVGDLGDAGFVERHAAAVVAAVTEHLPPGAVTLDWPSLLADAGFEMVNRGELRLSLAAPLEESARRYVLQGLQASQPMVAERLAAADVATLAVLASDDDPRSVLHREDLTVHLSRSFLLSRRS